MLAGVLGIVALCLLLLAVGGFMEGDIGKVAKFGTLFAICAIVSAFTATSHPGASQNCHIEWDGRANSEVCD
jgi:hypothetical protein